MSKTIDEKIVEMKFDNKEFETNVQQSMSTLDKLKAKLKFEDSAKGLENIKYVSEKVNMKGMSDAIDTVRAKFSAMEVVGVTVLANITNSAVNAGKALVKSLSTDQITSGWNKMNQKVGSVQTLVNSTGLSVKEIDEYLSELMWFSDETSYGFTDMTQALAQMTSTGGDIKKLVPMITGIANATAFAGKGAAEFSRVIYNLNQSYGAGSLQLMDWKSVQLAGVNSKQLTQELIKAGEELGKIQKGQVTIGNFNESLKDKWATTEVMELAFGRFSKLSQAAYKAVQAGEYDTASEAIQALAKDYDELAVKAFRSAQEAKSFKEAIDATKDASSSAWMNIFSDIFGNYEQQKVIWTDLANSLYDTFVEPIYNLEKIINDAFNFDAFGEMWDKLTNNKLITSMEEVSNKVKDAGKSLKEYQDMVNKIWRGDYKNQPYRKDLVEAEGWNYSEVQSLVNLGYKHKITTDELREAQEKYGTVVENTTEEIKEEHKITEELNDETLRKLGLNNDEIKMYRSLERASKKYGLSIDEIINKMKNANGRDLIFGKKSGKVDEEGNDIYEVMGVVQNLGEALSNVANAIKKAWSEVFDAFGSAELYMVLNNINEFTARLRDMTRDQNNMSKLTNTFKGLFAILKLISTLVGGGFKIVWTIFKTVLETCGMTVLDFTGAVGNLIAMFVDFITENNFIINGIVGLTKIISSAIIAFYRWVTSFVSLNDVVNNVVNGVDKMKEAIKNWFKGLKDTDNIGKYIIDGFINGLQSGASGIWNTITSIFTKVIDMVKSIFQIHSPSKVFFAIGGFIIAGLLAGLMAGQGDLFKGLQDLGTGIIDFFKGIKLGDIIAVGASAGLIFLVNKVLDTFQLLTKPLNGLSNMFNSIGGLFNNLSGAVSQFTKNLKYQGIAEIIKSIAIAIGTLVAAIVVLGKLDSDTLIQGGIALGVIAVGLAAFIGGLALMSDKLAKVKLPDVGKILSVLLGSAVAISIIASALKKIAKIDSDKIGPAIIGLIACMASLVALVVAIGFVSDKLKGTKNIDKMGTVMLKISASMWVVVTALKKMQNVNETGISNLIKVVLAIGGLLTALALLNKFTKNGIQKAGDSIAAVSGALLLLVIAMKLSGSLKKEHFINGIGVMVVFLAFITALMGISKLFKGTEMIKVSGSLLIIVGAMAMMALIMKLCSNLDKNAFIKGIACVTIFGVMIGILLKVAKNSESAHGLTLVGISTCIIALAAASVLLSLVKTENLIKGITAVGLLSLFVAGLVKATNGFQAGENSVKTLTTITIMIAVLSVIAVALSFLDTKKLIPAVLALDSLILSLAGVVYTVGKLKINKGTLSTLLLLTLIIGALAGIVSAMSFLPNSSSVMASAGAISILLGAITLVAFALNQFDQRKKVNIKGILQLGAILLVVAGVAGILAIMGNIDNAIQNAGALSLLLGVITLVLAGLSLIGQYLQTGVLVGVLGLAAVAASLLLVVASLAIMDGLKNATQNANALAILLGVMGIALTAISLVGNLVVGVIAGVLGLIVVATSLFILVGVLASMQDVQNAIPNAMALGILLGAMADALVKIGLVGPLVLIADAALLGLIGVIATFGVLATAVGALMTKFPQLQDFLDSGLVVLEGIAEGVGKVLGKLVSGFLTASTEGLPEIGSRLSMFMVNALPFITIAKTINDSVGNGVKSLAGALFALIGANILDSIAKFISNGESFSRLGKELSNFAINAMPFIMLMNTVKPESMQGAKNMADAILALTAGNLMDSITKWFAGDKDLAAFGNQLTPLAQGLSSFVNNITFGEDKIKVIDCACEGLKKLSETAKDIPATDGLWQWIAGQTDIKAFGEKLPDLADGLVKFVTALVKGEFTDDKINVVNCACEALKKLAEVAKAIPAEDGFWQWLSGKQDLKSFGEKLPDLASGICKFVNTLVEGGMADDKVDVVNSAVGVLNVVKDLANMDANNLSDKVGGLGDNLGKLGEKLKEFTTKLNELKSEDIDAAKEKLNQLINLCNTVISVDYEAINSFADKLSKFGSESMQAFVNALKDSQPKDDAAKAIIDIIDNFLSEADKKKSDVEKKFKEISEVAIEALKDKNSQAEEAGKNFAQGFANGIKWNSNAASSAGRSLGDKAYAAAKAAIDAHSPSKKTYKLGEFFDEGFINGIKSLQDRVYNSSFNVGEEARSGLAKAISKVSNYLESDIDANPTIRPVLDLDDVKSGMGIINSMFSQPNLAVATNLGAISYGMRTNRQNGNEDVVSAINGLKDNIGRQGDSYNINGITYDDGTEVANAIKTLVRAVKVEGRK